MIELRLIDNLDELHPVFAEWWQAHGFPVLPPVLLNTMGLVAVEGGKPLAACWVYTASTGVLAMLEWLVTDPKLTPRQAFVAVSKLVEFAREECARRGYAAVFTVCRQSALARVYERHGFEKTDEGVTSMLAILRTE